MTLEFPRMVFKDGGINAHAKGFYSFLVVNDTIEYDNAILANWYPTLPEALEPKVIDEPLLTDEPEIAVKPKVKRKEA